MQYNYINNLKQWIAEKKSMKKSISIRFNHISKWYSAHKDLAVRWLEVR